MTELKPCPFCGSTNVYIDSKFEVDTIYRFVSCHDCASHGSTWWHTEEEAIEAWNTRADSEESEYYNGYEQLMNRCADLTNLCRDMYETMHYLDPRHVYEYYTKRMEELGLLEGER